MGILIKLFWMAVVLAVGWALTHRLIPRLTVKTGRALGLRMRLDPIWERRINRFKTIKRGYRSFVAITTLFVLSLFLELLINNKPLVVYYGAGGGRIAFPAARSWLDTVVFFREISTFVKASDFGQVGAGEVDYRRFAAAAKDPDSLRPGMAKREAELESLKAELADASPPDQDSYAEEVQDYNDLKKMAAEVEAEVSSDRRSYEVFRDGRAFIIMPLYPYSPYEHLLDLPGKPPHRPGWAHPMGTEDSGTDVLAQLCYGFRVSLAFALVVAALGYGVGVIVGGVMGYYGGWTDIVIQRVIEIWSSIPFLFTIMIIASIIQPGFMLLALLLVLLRSWLGITYYVRGEFYREKAKDYVQAAIAMGGTDWTVMIRHILPNSLVPVVTFAPFGIVSYIMMLVSLDYLGFGLPVGTPSWGALLGQGMQYVKYYPHLILIPSVAFALTLFAVVMIGEAVREAFDPKVFSRLR